MFMVLRRKAEKRLNLPTLIRNKQEHGHEDRSKTSIKQMKRRIRIKNRLEAYTPQELESLSKTPAMSIESKYDHLRSNTRRSRLRRNRKRSSLLEETNLKKITQKRIAESQSINTEFDPLTDFRIVDGAWEGKTDRIYDETIYTLEELVEMGMKIVNWNGMYVQLSILIISNRLTTHHVSDHHVLRDKDGRGLAFCIGRPRSESYMKEVVNPISEHMCRLRSELILPKKNLAHRRGQFAAVNMGYSLGPGSSVCKQSRFN
jgi:hypothetical protein